MDDVHCNKLCRNHMSMKFMLKQIEVRWHKVCTKRNSTSNARIYKRTFIQGMNAKLEKNRLDLGFFLPLV